MVYPHTYRTEHSETHTTNAVYGEYYQAMQRKKIRIGPELLKIFQYVDSRREQLLNDLDTAVSIKSVSGNLKYSKEVHKMRKFAEDWLNKLDVKYECFNVGHYFIDGAKTKIPPVILASIGNDPSKKTICVYLHLDVCNPEHQKWDTNPWKMTLKNFKYYGNGIACCKMPLLAWFHVINSFKTTNLPLPVNLKLVIESMHHQNSLEFGAFVTTRSQDFFANVDLVIECNSEWLGEKYPCLIYGTVGILNYTLTVERSENSKTEIESDMTAICETIQDKQDNIFIKGFNDSVEQITPDEEKLYENIQDFDVEGLRDVLPEYKKPWDKVKLLMSFWRLPSIIFGEIQRCICDKKDTHIIKRDFIIKIVPRQIVDTIDKLTKQHIQTNVKKLKIENKVTCNLNSSIRPWFENCHAPAYVAAKRAFIQVYKEDPNLIREDQGRQTVTIFDNVLEKPVILIPLCGKGANSDGEGNENITTKNYYEGTKLLAAMLYQYSYILDGKN